MKANLQELLAYKGKPAKTNLVLKQYIQILQSNYKFKTFWNDILPVGSR